LFSILLANGSSGVAPSGKLQAIVMRLSDLSDLIGEEEGYKGEFLIRKVQNHGCSGYRKQNNNDEHRKAI
jgi:hypothetical protein